MACIIPNDALLEVRDLVVEYESPRRVRTRALEGVTFEIGARESVGILGESGSGKSTLAMAILRLLPFNARVVCGSIRFCGRDILRASEHALEQTRGALLAMVFQQPGMALHPTMRVGQQIAEVLHAHRSWPWSRCRDHAALVLEQVFGAESSLIWDSYPHELSGGERQRVSIAQAVSCAPRLLIADEPTSSLDAVVQISVLDLFRRLKRDSGASFLYITHNPANLSGIADRVLVLHEGRLLETASAGRGIS